MNKTFIGALLAAVVVGLLLGGVIFASPKILGGKEAEGQVAPSMYTSAVNIVNSEGKVGANRDGNPLVRLFDDLGKALWEKPSGG